MKGLTGKRYFYRLGMREGFLGMRGGITTLERRAWPRWAQEAYCRGRSCGVFQRHISDCTQHEPHRFIGCCRHCGMRIKRREEA